LLRRVCSQHLEGSRFGVHLSTLAYFASTLVRPKRANTGGSRERLNGSQVYGGCTMNRSQGRIIALRRSREPPVAIFLSRIERYKTKVARSPGCVPKRLPPSAHSLPTSHFSLLTADASSDTTAPLARRITRCALAAMAELWVAIKSVVNPCSPIHWNACITRLAFSVSRFPVGSSAKSKVGR
jgi:hypothetical protein